MKLVRSLWKRLLNKNVLAWFDEKNLLPGDDWELEIDKAIDEYDFVITILSPASVRKVGYFQKELKRTLDRLALMPEGRRFIIPVKFGAFEMPKALSKIQWIETTTRNWFEKIVHAIKSQSG